MPLVTFKNISREYAGRYVLRNVSFELNHGQKTGLIGINGSGKTTVLRLLQGLEQPSQGCIDIAAEVRIGYVPQHVEFHTNQTVRDYILAKHRSVTEILRQKELALDHAAPDQMQRLLHEYQQARDSYDRTGGDHFEQRVHAMLDALGLAHRADHKVAQLSGGEQNVLSMTHALLGDPNLLLLDEPGNHLDYHGLAWLDEFLQRFRGAILIVSHNRYLLDRVVTGIFELENGSIAPYPGNYSAYRRIRQERLETQQRQYQAYQQRLAHIEALVRKFADIAQGHASDPAWGKRLRARRSQLAREKANAVEKPRLQGQTISPDFHTDPTRADIALQIRGYNKAFGDLELFKGLNWQIEGGQRWALVGPNGCGKTTLLRDIVVQGHWEHPNIRIGPSFTIGYAAQQQELLDPELTVFEELSAIDGPNRQQVLDILARFLFTDQEINKKTAQLSGGERNRLQLARLMLTKPNFLILDEPTNHLDIPTREAVEDALAEFQGAILVVSHDRYFLDKVVNHVARVENKTLTTYDGSFTDYWATRLDRPSRATGRITDRAKARSPQKEARTSSGGRDWQQRKADAAAIRKAQKHTQKLEEEINQTEREKDLISSQISQAFSRGRNEEGIQLSQQLHQITAHLDQLYHQWIQAREDHHCDSQSPDEP